MNSGKVYSKKAREQKQLAKRLKRMERRRLKRVRATVHLADAGK
jgi:hypothetical protein